MQGILEKKDQKDEIMQAKQQILVGQENLLSNPKYITPEQMILKKSVVSPSET